MRSFIARVSILIAAAVPVGAAAQAANAPDDAAALELADRTPAVPAAQPAKAWRAYGEVAGGRRWLRSPASSDDTGRLALDLRYDGTFAPGWRAVFSDRLDLVRTEGAGSRNVNALREAYVSWQARPDTSIDLGRVNLRHGTAWGYNPTDFFRGGALRSVVSPDPALLRENRLGTVVVQGQRVWSDSAVSAAFSPKLATTPSDAGESLDLGSTNARNRWLLTASHRFGAALSPQLLVYGGESTPTQVGLNVSTLLNSATVAFVEYAAGRDRSLVARALGRAEAESWRQRAALGLTYTTAFNLSLTVEADFNGAAPNRSQWDALRAGAPGSSLRLLQASQDLQELPVRRAAFVYAIWRDAFIRRLDLSGFVRYDAVTHSRAQWLETRYHWDGVDLALQWQLYSGGPDSVYGSVPQKRAVEASLRVYF